MLSDVIAGDWSKARRGAGYGRSLGLAEEQQFVDTIYNISEIGAKTTRVFVNDVCFVMHVIGAATLEFPFGDK